MGLVTRETAGTAYSFINRALQGHQNYTASRCGEVSAQAYQIWVQTVGIKVFTGLNEDQINLSARFPRDKHDFVQRSLSLCRAQDITDSEYYELESIELELAALDARFDHDDYLTYIFPEESVLLYAIVHTKNPSRGVCMGSFYGYWALAAKAAAPNMTLSLIDIDPRVMSVAQRNFASMGLETGTAFIVGDAEKVVSTLGKIDLLILDAEGPKSEDVAEDYRDKAIYYPHLRSALPMMSSGALMVAHNVILSNFTGGVYFEEKQRSYRQQYRKFLALVEEHFSYVVIDSTEGILVARKK